MTNLGRPRRSPDEDMRAAERAAREDGDLEAAAGVLAARLRAGDVELPGVELAAAAGDPASGAVTGVPPTLYRVALIAQATPILGGVGPMLLWVADCARVALEANTDRIPPEILGGRWSGLRSEVGNIERWATDSVDLPGVIYRVRTLNLRMDQGGREARASRAVLQLAEAVASHLDGAYAGFAPFGPLYRTQARMSASLLASATAIPGHPGDATIASWQAALLAERALR